MKLAILNKDTFSISTISIFFLFLLMLWSMEPWFAWNNKQIMIFGLSACFVLPRLILLVKNQDKYKITYSVLTVVALAFLVYFFVRLRRAEGMPSVLIFIRTVLVFAFVMVMNRDEKKAVITMTTNMYAVIVGISMIAYLFFISGKDLSYSIIMVPNNLFYSPFRNYKLFITLNNNGPRLLERFQSIFIEPGHLGTISAFILYINRYEIKRKSVMVIFISLLMSLSLAGYVLLILGYLIQIIARSKKIYITIFKIVAVTTLFFSLGVYYYTKYPDSMLSRLILSRLELDEKKGIRGYNRTKQTFDYFYETQFLISTESIILGTNLNEDQKLVLFGRGGNNSYKTFILTNGIISLLLLFFMYLSIVAITPSRLGFGLLLLYSLSFLQRVQTPLWDMQLFLFVGAIQCFYTDSYRRTLNDIYGKNK